MAVKKTSAKKPAAKKPAGKTAKAKPSAAQTKLANELKKLIPQLDAEGLAFLVEQGRIHLYNMQVDKLNSAARAADAATARTREIASGKKQAGTAKSAKAKGLRIEGTQSGSSYYLYCGNNDVMFSRGEMAHLVKIVNGPGSDLEIRERLYNWFDQERMDVFSVLPMRDKFDDNLKIFATYLKKNFKIRK